MQEWADYVNKQQTDVILLNKHARPEQGGDPWGVKDGTRA